MGNILRVKDPDGNWMEVISLVGPKGDPGNDGADGKDGVPCTHSWKGTTLTVTSASGTSSADLKGEKGDKGDPGGINGGTLNDILVAYNNTEYTTKQVRNIFISTEEPTAADGDNGDIWIRYVD